MLLGAPLLLGSICGLIIGLIAVFVLAGRIIGEEKMRSMNWKVTKIIRRR